jgi:hypothetical protein
MGSQFSESRSSRLVDASPIGHRQKGAVEDFLFEITRDHVIHRQPPYHRSLRSVPSAMALRPFGSSPDERRVQSSRYRVGSGAH